MITKNEIIEQIRLHKPELSRFGVSEVGLFGSFSRNQQSESSDLDILIDFQHDKESFDNFMAVFDILESAFQGQRVEVITKNGLSQYIGPEILKEVIYV